jgi:uncharacterized protein (DUF1697 family)
LDDLAALYSADAAEATISLALVRCSSTRVRTLAGTFVALLRGINVGKAKRVAMSDLRMAVEDLGYRNARTLLNSGNIVFDAPGATSTEVATRVEEALETKLGLRSRVTVLPAAEFASVIEENPIAARADNPSRMHAAFITDPKDISRLEQLATRDWAPESLALGRRVAYLWCPDGVAQSELVEQVGRALRDGVTIRNWATVMKIMAAIEGR